MGPAVANVNMAEAKTPSPAERRTAIRHELEVQVDFESEHNFYTGLTQDISTGGLFVSTNQIKKVGDRVRLKFSLPNQGVEVEVETEVRWVRETSSLQRNDCEPGMGLRFINLTPAAKQVIETFLKERESLFYDDE